MRPEVSHCLLTPSVSGAGLTSEILTIAMTNNAQKGIRLGDFALGSVSLSPAMPDGSLHAQRLDGQTSGQSQIRPRTEKHVQDLNATHKQRRTLRSEPGGMSVKPLLGYT